MIVAVFKYMRNTNCFRNNFKLHRSEQPWIVRSLKEIIVTIRVQAPHLAEMFLWVYETNLEGVPRYPNFRGGGGEMARGSKSADLFQHVNEADESLCTFTRVSPANVTSNFRKNLLMGL